MVYFLTSKLTLSKLPIWGMLPLALLCFWGLQPKSAFCKSLKFSVDNKTFFKNLEREPRPISAPYTIPPGQTITGSILKPSFQYNVKKGVDIELGGLMNLPFGHDDRVSQGDPIISLHYDFRPGWRFTAGTLNREHPLLDAIFDDDLEFTDPVEQGFQFQADTQKLRQDLWIDWELNETSTRKEKFSLGNYTQWISGNFMVDGQFYWVHSGGQRNSGGPAENNFTYALGMGYSFSKTRFQESNTPYRKKWDSQKTGFTVHFINSRDKIPNVGVEGFTTNEDNGLLFKLFTTRWNTDFYIRVWTGGSTQFIPGKGDPLYTARDFEEFGLKKTWWIDDDISIRGSYQVSEQSGEITHTELVSVQWHVDFEFFKNQNRTAPTRPWPDSRNFDSKKLPRVSEPSYYDKKSSRGSWPLSN